MAKFAKKEQNVLFWNPCSPNTSKNVVSGKLNCHFLDIKIMYLH